MAERGVTDAFAALLADTESPDARNSLMKRAEMQAMVAAPEAAFEAPIVTLGEYRRRKLKVPPMLVAPLVARGTILTTVGRAGKGKTSGALNRIVRWSAGLPWFDDWPHMAPFEGRPLKTLIVENEGAGGMFQETINLMVSNGGFTDDQLQLVDENVLIWGDGGYSGMKLDNPEKLHKLRTGIEKHRPDIVFLEPFRGLWSGEENSSTDMAQVGDALSELASDFSCGVWVTHHERKNGAGDDGEKMSAGRGSTVLEAIVATFENFESVKAGEQRELSISKCRYERPKHRTPPPVRMRWNRDTFWYEHVPEDAVSEAIRAALRETDGALDVKTMAEVVEENAQTIRRRLKKMAEEGEVTRLPGETIPGHGREAERYMLAAADGTGMDF